MIAFILSAGVSVFNFLRTGAGVVVIAAVVGGFLTHELDQRVYKGEQAAAAQKQIDELSREALASTQIAEQANARAKADDAYVASIRKKVQTYVQRFASLPPSARCAFSDDDVRSLRNIVGPPVSGNAARRAK